MPAPDLRTLAGASIVMEQVMALARANFERDRELIPVAFVFATFDPVRRKHHPPTVFVVGAKGGIFHNTEEKDAFDRELRRLVREHRALAVGLVAEAWSVRSAQLSVEQQAHAEKHGLKDHPDRIEIVTITLEHTEGHRQWEAVISRPESDPDHPTLGEFVEAAVEWNVGRFTNLLPGSGPKSSGNA
jgi:hypothetical protein